MSDTPSLAELLRRVIDSRLVDVHTSIPGKILAYDADTQEATVAPQVKRAYTDEEGAREVEDLPAIPGVPVVFPRAGGYRVTFPVAVGDTVLLVFSEASIDRWKSRGGCLDPGEDARHELSGAVAIIGLYDFAHALSDAPTDRMSVGKDGGPTIEIDDSEIRLGSNSASSLLALKSDVTAIINAISGAAVSGGDGGATFKTNILAALGGIPVGTTKVKGE